jgi:hypothetical protein
MSNNIRSLSCISGTNGNNKGPERSSEISAETCPQFLKLICCQQPSTGVKNVKHKHKFRVSMLTLEKHLLHIENLNISA